jgi:endonuclease I
MNGRWRARWLTALVMLCAVRCALAQSDPPATYYSTATGTGATLKSQLNSIIDGHTTLSYDALRTALQVTDADPNATGRMILVYDRTSLNVAAINPGGPIPGWDNAATWNREHVWPQSIGLDSTSPPDGSDLHHLRPSDTDINSDRGNLDFGGAYGSRPGGQMFGVVSDGGTFWYPGDADAGMIAREMFYMAVRYDGADSGTTDLELAAGAPSGGSSMGNLTRMIEWNYLRAPDSFERGRNQIIFANYQGNRNPFIDHPEWAWSIFVDQANDSQVSISGATVAANGSSSRTVDLGRVYVGGTVPSATALTASKTGNDGTYFSVTTSGAATSTLSGTLNPMRVGGTDSRALSVGLSTSTATAGLKTGAVTIDNLDITTAGGAGRGANDANDTINVNLSVLNHPIASFASTSNTRTQTINFGTVPLGATTQQSVYSLFNLTSAGGGPAFPANLDLDSLTGSGDTDVLLTGATLFSNLAAGGTSAFQALLNPTRLGSLFASYTLNLSGENLPGAQNQTLTLQLMASVIPAGLAGDYNENGVVDAADYTLWRDNLGGSVMLPNDSTPGSVTQADYDVWVNNFGASAATVSAASVPEPAAWTVLIVLALALQRAPVSRRG